MIRPDYDVGDEVVYVGSRKNMHGGPYFCLSVFESADLCAHHGLNGCLAATISSAGRPQPDHKFWCSASWRKAPTGKEQSSLTTSRKAKVDDGIAQEYPQCR